MILRPAQSVGRRTDSSRLLARNVAPLAEPTSTQQPAPWQTFLTVPSIRTVRPTNFLGSLASLSMSVAFLVVMAAPTRTGAVGGGSASADTVKPRSEARTR